MDDDNLPSQSRGVPATTSKSHDRNVSVYQTTGPDAHAAPIMTTSGSEPALNPRSCVTCRRRKVRCDKQMPCSNCRRARIPCAFPAPGRAPRQVRPKDPNAAGKNSTQREAELIKRLRKLEGVVEELSGQLEVEGASKAGSPGATFGDGKGSSSSSSHVPPVHRSNTITSGHSSPGDAGRTGSDAYQDSTRLKRVGRLVSSDHGDSARYVSNAFWAKLNDELDAIRDETDIVTDDDLDDDNAEPSSEETPSSIGGLGLVPDHHGFILGYRSADVDLGSCHPSAPHASYLWEVYKQNVEPLVKLVHVPTMENVFRDLSAGYVKLSANTEALVFAIYLGSITSLDEKETRKKMNVSRDHVLNQFRFAAEQALARANFLCTSDITVVQAMTLFLTVVRRHDDSRFCWAITGLLIRIAQGMGMHRDGSNFGLTTYEIEMRRRIWWNIVILDSRASEEMGTELGIADRSCDTQKPLNINDNDLNPLGNDVPAVRLGRTDMMIPLVRMEIATLSRKLYAAMSVGAAICPQILGDRDTTIPERERMLVALYHHLQTNYLQFVLDEQDPLYWVTNIIVRVIIAKMCLTVYQPMLFPCAEADLGDDILTRIYITAIEVIEYTNKLNQDNRCKQYRWLFQTYTNWNAIAYVLIQSCRRPWSALVERGWKAVYRYDTDPVKTARTSNHMAVFLPLRRLWAQAKKHRESEIARLRADPEAAFRLDQEDGTDPSAARFGPVPGTRPQITSIRAIWRRLVGLDDMDQEATMDGATIQGSEPVTTVSDTTSATNLQPGPQADADPGHSHNSLGSNVNFDASINWNNAMMVQPEGTDVPSMTYFRNDNSFDGTSMSTMGGGEGDSSLDAFLDMLPSAFADTRTNDDNPGPVQEKPARHVPPYLWDGMDPSGPVNDADTDMLHDDFNWQDWNQNIRGMQTDSSSILAKGWGVGASFI